MSVINIKNLHNRRDNSSGFSLMELLVTMVISGIFGIIVIQSYSISTKLATNIGLTSNFNSTISAIQIYLKKELIGAGSGIADPGNGLPKYFGIRSVNNANCTSNSFLQNIICGTSTGLPKVLAGSDVIAINSALPFGIFGQFGSSTSGINDNLHYAVNVVSADSSNIQTEVPNPFFNNSTLYLNSLIVAYNLTDKANVLIGQVTGFSSPDTIKYTKINDYMLGKGVNISTITSGSNVRVALFNGVVIYLSEQGDLISLILGPGTSAGVRYRNAKIIATGVDDFQLRYGFTTATGLLWSNTINFSNSANSNHISKLKIIKVAFVLSNHSYKVCRNIADGDKPSFSLFGHTVKPLANKNSVNSLKDPCKFRVTTFNVAPYNYLYNNNN